MMESDSDFGPDHIYIGMISYALGVTYKAQDRYEEAEKSILK